MPVARSTKSWQSYLAIMTLPVIFLHGTNVEAQESCEIPPDWISKGIPDPSILAEHSKFNSLCDFHQWAWNAFLWSMEETNGVLRFETFPTQEQTIDASFDAADKPEMPTLKLRVGKGDHPIDSIAQAGTNGILVAQNSRAVYFSQYVDPQMYNQIIRDDWYNAQGLIDTPDTALFEIGNIEYKAAWAVVDDTYSVPGAFTRKAPIPLLANVEVNGVTTITVPADPTYVEAEVALIGLHVVGWVNGHTEAIWATFSPIGIAPVVPLGQNGAPALNPGDPVSGVSTPFYSANTTLGDCNQTQVPVQTLDESTQKLSHTTQVCQQYDAGSLLPNDAANRATIESINTSAASVLPDGNIAKGYSEAGAIWSKSDATMPNKLNTTFQDDLLGSTVLSNPVIETFTQTDVAQDNCFACHNSLQFQPRDPEIPPLHASMLNLSHFLMKIYVDTYKSSN